MITVPRSLNQSRVGRSILTSAGSQRRPGSACHWCTLQSTLMAIGSDLGNDELLNEWISECFSELLSGYTKCIASINVHTFAEIVIFSLSVMWSLQLITSANITQYSATLSDSNYMMILSDTLCSHKYRTFTSPHLVSGLTAWQKTRHWIFKCTQGDELLCYSAPLA